MLSISFLINGNFAPKFPQKAFSSLIWLFPALWTTARNKSKNCRSPLSTSEARWGGTGREPGYPLPHVFWRNRAARGTGRRDAQKKPSLGDTQNRRRIRTENYNVTPVPRDRKLSQVTWHILTKKIPSPSTPAREEGCFSELGHRQHVPAVTYSMPL